MTGGSGRVVLVAEDDDLLLRLAVRVLERAGHRVITASDGDEAQRLFAQRADEIDTVLLDLRMAPPGGVELVEGVRERRGDAGIVVVSGSPPDPDQAARLRRHRALFLRKPFAPEALVESMDAAIAGARGSR